MLGHNEFGYPARFHRRYKRCVQSVFDSRLSTCEVYGKTIGSFLPKDSPLHQDPAYYVLKEDTSPCIFGLVEKLKSIDGRMYVPNN
ncbi:hypothetical protein HanRHA438_Chr06g0282591 [Helianthus annuus]|nr:hypothetical protein HanIR_Chr06g0293931 [Helianthus annuus]KAJ0913173.1 hypothetical protein HanRHA438_Chr06g0282591 [Helianthus annuus]KAJ0916655.1 hypothetical protein HanPSC8_Chr06g0264231 [Helianthus annuus]